MDVSLMLYVIHTLHLPRISGLFPHQWNEQIDSCPSGHLRPLETLQVVHYLPQRKSLRWTKRQKSKRRKERSSASFSSKRWMQKSNLICFDLLLQEGFKILRFWQVLQTQLTHHTGLVVVNKRIQICLTVQSHRTWACLLLHVAHNAIYFRSRYR